MHVFIKNRYEKWKEPLDDSLTGEKKNVGFSTNGETWFVPGASSNATAQGKRKIRGSLTTCGVLRSRFIRLVSTFWQNPVIIASC